MSDLIPLIATIIGAILTVFLTYNFINRKILVYDKLFEGPILTIEDSELQQQLQLRGKPIENIEDLKYIVLRIENFWFKEIKQEDYEDERAFFIDLGEETTIKSAIPGESNPDNLNTELNIENGKLFVNPMLLNRKWNFTVKILAKNHQGKIEPKARITGVREIKERRKLKSTMLKWASNISFIFAIIIPIIFTYVSLEEHWNLPFILLLFFGIILRIWKQEQSQKFTGYEEKVVERIRE